MLYNLKNSCSVTLKTDKIFLNDLTGINKYHTHTHTQALIYGKSGQREIEP